MADYARALKKFNTPDEGRLGNFFDIDAGNPAETERQVAKQLDVFQTRHHKTPVSSAPPVDLRVITYKVSGWDEFRGKNFEQHKLPQDTQKTAKELLGQFKIMENIQLPGIFEDAHGNIWTKI